MAPDSSSEWDWAERWDQMFDVLSAEPRREVIGSLLEEPPERRLPLPDAAASPNQQTDRETLRVQLHHHHLPKLADAGYVVWGREPFEVWRGPHFEEPALIVGSVFDSVDEIPRSLVDNCKVIGGTRGDDTQ